MHISNEQSILPLQLHWTTHLARTVYLKNFLHLLTSTEQPIEFEHSNWHVLPEESSESWTGWSVQLVELNQMIKQQLN